MSLRWGRWIERTTLLLVLLWSIAPRLAAAQACPADKFCFYVPPGLPLEGSHSGTASRVFDLVLSSPVRTVAGTYSVGGATAQSFTVSPGTSVRIPLTAVNGPASAYGVAEQKGIFLVADSQDLTVDHRETFDQEQYSETIKRHSIALGSRFRLGGYSLNLQNHPNAGADAVLIYAPTGGTVTLSAPPGATLPFWSGSATADYSVTLTAGQTVAVRTVIGKDLDGGLLTSTLPVSVSSGGRGWSSAGCGDDGMDGLVPVSALGTEYVVRLPTGSFAGNGESRVTVIADVDATEVRVNGTLVATLSAGQHHNFQPTTLSYVQTSRPALVWMNGSLDGCELDTVLIPPIAFRPALTELSLDFSVLSSAETPPGEMAILIATADVGSIRLGGVAPTLTSNLPVPGRPALSYVRFDVTSGDKNVRAGSDFQALLATRTAPSGLLAYYNPYRIPGCGDGGTDPGETCDDGDLIAGDGCSATCQREPGYTCSGEPSTCATTCGDTQIGAPIETCDDGNGTAGDGCNSNCRAEVRINAPAAGSSTIDTTPTITGSAEPGVVVTIQIGTSSTTVTTDSTGSWSFTPTTALPDGAQTVTATGTDGLGGMSSSTRSFTIDSSTTVAITAPAAGSTTGDTTPTILGTGEPGATVQVSIDGISVGSATVRSDGTWDLTVSTALTAGSKVVTAVTTDLTNNMAMATPVTFSVDTSTMLAITAPATGAKVNDSTPTITGTAEPGATVMLTLTDSHGAVVNTTATAQADSTWSVTVGMPLAEGVVSVMARSADGVGNMAMASSTFSIETTTGPLLEIRNPPDQSRTQNTRPPLTGISDPGAHVSILLDGVLVDTVTSTARGSWSVELIGPLSYGPHVILATTTDADGRTATDQHNFIVDAAVPAVTITKPAAGSVVGDTTPTITGTATPGLRVSVQIDGNAIGEVSAGSDGSWSIDAPTALVEGRHAVRATGDAGATPDKQASFEVGFYVDTKTFVSILLPAEGGTVGFATPTMAGLGEPGAMLSIAIDGAPVGDAVVQADGTWYFTLKMPLAPGAHTVSVRAMDAIGNQAQDENAFTYDPGQTDSDGDGRPDRDECTASPCPDSDGDGKTDERDDDDDGDGIPTADECTSAPCRDTDGDGKPNYLDPDDDDDGRPTIGERNTDGTVRDTDHDGLPDHLDPDDDGDGLSTRTECPAAPCVDTDRDSVPDFLDPDDDNDRIPTARERDDGTRAGNNDLDGDGLVAWHDPDANNNGAPDGSDGITDTDGDGLPNYIDLDTPPGGLVTEEEAISLAGGGGCSAAGHAGGTGGGSSDALSALCLALAGLALRRRPRRESRLAGRNAT